MFKRLKALSVVPFVLFLSGCFLLGAEITVNFDVQGGVPIEPKVYTISTNESVYSYLPTPVKEGHTFVGWFAGTEGRDEVNVSQAVEGQLFVYARWEINEYIFEVERPEEIGSIDFQLEYDAEIPLDELDVVGYDFEGLYWDEAYTDSFNFDRLPGEDITVYAKYEPKSYQITFHANYLNDTISETFDIPFRVSIPYPTYNQAEAAFDGWYTGSFFATAFNETNMPAYNIDLYAKWEYNEYPLSYYLNGGTNISGITRASIDYGSEINLTPPTRPGYSFKGWFENETLTTPASISVMTNTAVALYAKWEERDYEVSLYEEGTLEFIKADSNYDASIYLDERNQLYAYGDLFGRTYNQLTNITDAVNLNPNEVIIDIQIGYSHLMILTSQGRVFTRGGNTTYLGTNGVYTSNMTFNDITRGFNGAFITGIYTQTQESFAWTNDGQVFMFGPAFENKLIGETPVTEDALSPVDISSFFELSAEETIISIEYGQNSGYALSNIGRVFVWGSNDQRTLTGDIVSSSVPLDITDTFTLQTGETIVDIAAAMSNGFVLTSNGRLFGWGERYDNTLMRWYENAVDTPIDLTGQFDLLGDDKLVAIFTAERTGYAVSEEGKVYSWGANWNGQIGNNTTEWMEGTYLMNGNLELNSNETIKMIRGSYDSTVLISSEGRLFILGANRDGRFPIPVIASNVPYELVRDDWKEVSTTILNYEDPITLVTPPSIEGYTFEGYYLDTAFTQAFNFELMPDEDLNIYPKYVANTYAINFEENGGITVPAINVGFNNALNLPTPSRYGYTFEGWFVDNALSEMFRDTLMPARELTLYAKWEAITFTVDYYASGILSYEKVAVSEDATLFITQGDRLILFGLYEDPNGSDGFDITDRLGLQKDEKVEAIYPAKEGFFLVTNLNRLLGFALRNNNGQFGRTNLGHEFSSLTVIDMTEMINLEEGESISKAVSGGWGASAILTSEGRIIMWGWPHHNTYVSGEERYELGIFLELEEGEVFTDIHFGETSTLVKTSNNRIFTWGDNWNGQLGSGSNAARSTALDLTERLSGLFDIADIKLVDMGIYASLIVTEEDLIYKAGGILNSHNTFTLLNAQIDLNENETIVEIDSSREYIIVRTSESRIFVYGYKERSFLSLLEVGNDWEINQFENLFKDVSLLPGESIIDMAIQDNYAVFVTNFGEAFFIGNTPWYEDMVEGFGPFELDTINYEGWMLYEKETYAIDETFQLLSQNEIDDFIFNGWFTSPNLSQPYQGPLENVNIILYGNLNPVSSLLTFEENGGTNVATISGISSDKVDLPIPSRTGYTFEGWYLDEALTEPFYQRRLPGGETTLYAKWALETFTIDYYALEGFVPLDIAASDKNVLIITNDDRLIAYGSSLFTGDLSVPRDLTRSLGLRNGETLVSVHAGENGPQSPFMIVTSLGRILGLGHSNNGLLSETRDYDYGLIDEPRDLTQKLELQNGETIVKLVLERNNAMVLTSSGRLIAWGENGDSGVLGVGNFNWGILPVDITSSFDLENDDKIIDISMGDNHVIALSEDGKIFTWGDGTFGQLGNNRTDKLNVPTELDARRINLEVGETITQILAGDKLSYIKTSSSRLLVFGYWGNAANLDDGNADIQSPLDITDLLDLEVGESISEMKLDYWFLTIYTSLGNVYYVGHFNGINYSRDLTSFPESITFESGEYIESIESSYNYGILLTNQGNLYIGGSTLDTVLNDDFGAIKAYTPTVYTLVETQEYNFGDTITYRNTSSDWLDVEILSDLDISDPVTYTTMPDQDLTLYEE